MKMLAAAVSISALAIAPALAQTAPDKPKQICLQPFGSPPGLIDHTHAVDANTLLVYMKDGKIWKNTLRTPSTPHLRPVVPRDLTRRTD